LPLDDGRVWVPPLHLPNPHDGVVFRGGKANSVDLEMGVAIIAKFKDDASPQRSHRDLYPHLRLQMELRIKLESQKDGDTSV